MKESRCFIFAASTAKSRGTPEIPFRVANAEILSRAVGRKVYVEKVLAFGIAGRARGLG